MTTDRADNITHQITVDGVEYVYETSCLVDKNNERLDRAQREGIPHGVVTPNRRLDHITDTYPKNPDYTFQEFAGPVFEFGGYGDVTLVDPYTLRRLWVGNAVDPAEKSVGGMMTNAQMYDSLRNAINVAEAVGFLDHE